MASSVGGAGGNVRDGIGGVGGNAGGDVDVDDGSISSIEGSQVGEESQALGEDWY